jgi:hypothetical protein
MSFSQFRRQFAFSAVLSIALGSVILPGQAATEMQYEGAFKRFIAAETNKSEVKPAYEAFDSLRAAKPSDPVLLVYTGAAHTRMATTASEPMAMLAYVDNGVAQIEKALAMLTPAHDAPGYGGEPASLTVRFIAASTFLSLPETFHKGPRGAKLLDEGINSPAFVKASPAFQANVLMRAAYRAQQSKKISEARRYAMTVINKKLPQSGDAQALLTKLEN